MNKVLVSEKKNTVIGSNALETAVIPKRKIEEEVSREQREKEQKIKKVKQYSKNLTKLKLLGKLSVSFLLLVVIIGKSAGIYETQRNIASIKNEIKRMSVENDNMRLQLSKASDIKEVEEKAKNELAMLEASRGSAVVCDINKDYFTGIKDEDKKEQKSIWDTLKKWLF